MPWSIQPDGGAPYFEQIRRARAASVPFEFDLHPLVQVLEEKYGSINAASRKVDIPQSTLHRLNSGERQEISLRTFVDLCVATDVSPENGVWIVLADWITDPERGGRFLEEWRRESQEVPS